MGSQKIPIFLNLLAAVFGALGQYAYKKGGQKLSVVPLWQNYQFLAGVLLFGAVMACFLIGYKLGGRISVVYPFYATTFIWGSLIGYYLEGEAMNWWLFAGVGLIVAGLATIAKGSAL